MPKGRAEGAHVRHVGRLSASRLSWACLLRREMWRSHQSGDRALRSDRLQSFVRLLAEQTERTIQAIDLTLIGIRDALQVAPEPAARRSCLSGHLEGAAQEPPLCPGAVRDRSGRVHHARYGLSHDTACELGGPPLLSRRIGTIPSLGLHIGRPLRSRSLRTYGSSASVAGSTTPTAALPESWSRPSSHATSSASTRGSPRRRTTSSPCSSGTARCSRARPTTARPLARSIPASSRLVFVQRGASSSGATSPIDGAAGRRLSDAGRRRRSWWSQAWPRQRSTTRGSITPAVVGGGCLLVWLLAPGWPWSRMQPPTARSCWSRRALAQSQRLETMGRIAGGVAHDLGNTIKIARTTFTLLKPSLMSQRDAMALVEDADRSLKSAFEIIDRLLAFARRQELRPRPTDLADAHHRIRADPAGRRRARASSSISIA